MSTDRKIERRLRTAGILVGLGLTIQLLTLLWIHPLAFMMFLAAGIPITAAGVLLYLVSLLAASRPTPPG
jgi:hypothetical protein